VFDTICVIGLLCGCAFAWARRVWQVFDACEELGGAIIFMDEIDAIAASRDSGNMHEATRRILSVVLRKVSDRQALCSCKQRMWWCALQKFNAALAAGEPSVCNNSENRELDTVTVKPSPL
jgi:ATPase family associated with various cellular activities (AAA)